MKKPRIVFLVPAGLSLLAALDAGLFRIGWPFPLPRLDLPLAHGPLMVSGFLGTLIGLEKAVALRKPWAYVGPAATGIGGIGLVLAPLALTPRVLFVAGGAVLVAVCASFVRRHRSLANACLLGGAALWLLGNGLWLSGWPVYAVVPSWIGFLLLTIAGERLELNRLLSPSRTSRLLFQLAAAAVLLGIGLAAYGFHVGGQVSMTVRGDVFTSSGYDSGIRVLGGALLALGLWLLRNDMAKHALKKPGLSRFMAVTLLAGYVWLLAAGALFARNGGFVAGELYDAALHSFFLGFVFSMIFAHGPVIFPAILERPLDFHPAFCAHVALLHVGLVLRLVGDFTELYRARPWGGLLNAAAILLFLVNTVIQVAKGGGR